jgi:hypothetical protein
VPERNRLNSDSEHEEQKRQDRPTENGVQEITQMTRAEAARPQRPSTCV